MAIKTFDANRVGGGTFQLEQDSLTGEYKVKEVGFVKLPELKLPEIEQAAPKAITPADPTTDTPVDVGGVQTSDEGSGERDSQQDFTGTSMLKNIQEEATKFSRQDTGIDRTSMDQGAIQMSGLREKEAYDKAVANYNAIAERNRDLAIGKQSLSEEDRLQNKVDLDGARNEMDAAREKFEGTFETIKAAPKIADFSQGPRTVGEKIPDRIMERTSEFGSLSIPKDKNIVDKAKDLISNSVTVKVVTAGAQVVGSMLKGAGEAILGPETNSQVHARRYFNLAGGTGSQVQRIGGNPATDLYAGANRNARELDDYGQKRIDMIEKNLAAGKYRDPEKQRQKLEKFKQDQKDYRESRNEDMRDREEAALSDKTKSVDYGITGGATRTDIDVGDGGSESPGGKSIVCTAMYQTTGLQDWSKAMKIWYIYQKRYLTIQHQEGYHRLFKPFVKGMHKSNIIKAIGAHFAKHRTQHLKHVLFKSKPSLLGKIYSKVLETICYWVGKI